ncbi:helix-turn-helix domain-containing protein [Streptomyces griseosporeus]|uniref:helix-turn-helix domain-containing protein n=1 Tax=Streptomyces griseosporeus TaxID=1910 RepID=UPI0036FA6BAF
MPARFDPAPLRNAAAQRGHYNVTAIARELGLPYQTVIRWTAGRNVPGGPALAAIERAYGVTAAALFPVNA